MVAQIAYGKAKLRKKPLPLPLRFGIDLGGTKIEIAALAPDGKELLRRRVATPVEDYAAILGAVVALVADAERELRGRGSVGIGTPGSLSRATGRLRGSTRYASAGCV